MHSNLVGFLILNLYELQLNFIFHIVLFFFFVQFLFLQIENYDRTISTVRWWEAMRIQIIPDSNWIRLQI